MAAYLLILGVTLLASGLWWASEALTWTGALLTGWVGLAIWMASRR